MQPATSAQPVGFGVIGAGIVGGAWHAHVYSRLPHARLVAVCDLDAQRAAAVADACGSAAVYTDYRELLARPDIAAVSVATPDFAHREIAVAAAEAGKHILVEKPLATTVADAEAIVAAARRAGVKLMVDFHNRVNPLFVAAQRSLRAGEIGRPAYIYARLSNTTYVPTRMLAWAGRSSALWFLASHTVDLARWLLEDEPQRVYAVSRAGILQGLGVDAPDFHTAIVEFRGGAVVNLESAWILPESAPNIFDFKVEILGSTGAIAINGSDHRAIETYTTAGARLPDLFGMPGGESPRLHGFVLESIARFVDAVVDDQPLPATGEDGVRATQVLAAIAESAASGQPVTL
ncbi:MAG TPA: Gfo/Idh/MocA family oxidoreductase [Roseiflexaceae bacterium]|nr:Gfo/Idh/MocA family oxidoreductase [Roseiflexaceae bacterium]HMP42183.1 Gfo/Idh/MocA family oxidoreductase [Roseiflexaceae bacterium]